MLAALPVIHTGQKRFAPYAELDKNYVNAAISSGESEFMHKALKTTETARAMAHESHLVTMTLMQLAAGALAIMFAFNSFFMFRQQREPIPIPIRVRP
jgi:hypothetical protein